MVVSAASRCWKAKTRRKPAMMLNKKVAVIYRERGQVLAERHDGDCSIALAKGKIGFRNRARAELRRSAFPSSSLPHIEERVEHLGPPSLEIDLPLESALQQSLDSPLRLRPRQRGQEGVEGVEEPIGGWQGDLIDEILRRRGGTTIEGGDPPRERVDEAVQFRVRKCPVDVSVPLRGVAVEV